MLAKKDMGNTYIKFSIPYSEVQFFLWQLLFFLMITVPRTNQISKIIILFILFGLSLARILITRKIRFPNNVKVFMGIHLIYVIYSGFLGLFRSNPGATDFLRINMLYYILLLISLGSFFSYEYFQKSIRTMIVSANVVSIYSILLLLVELEIWPKKYFIYFSATSRVGIHDGYTHLTNTNLSMMIFILPFLMILYLNEFQFENLSKKNVLITITLGVISVIISGRRILWICFIVPIIYYFLKVRRTKSKLKTMIIALVALIIVTMIMSTNSIVSFESMKERFIDAFDSSEESARFLQIQGLWKGFLKNPIFGSGAGIGVSDVIRSYTSPWNYEMTYNLILYNSGLIGFGIFTASHLYLFMCLIKEYRKGSKIGEGLLITYIIVMIANGTNPYFTSSFDFLWFIIFPLMYFYTENIQKELLC